MEKDNIDSSYYDEDYPIDSSMIEMYKNLDIVMEKEKKKFLYKKLYSNFNNFTVYIKKNIIINTKDIGL